MKHFTAILLMIAVLFSASSSIFAQSTSTQGTEFWVSFMSNGHKYHPSAPNNGNWILTQLLISSKRDCSGTISNPQTGWSTPFSVQANNITTIEIPEDQAYIDATSEQVQNKGLQVISNDTISVFCTNIAYLSFDASYVLPTQSLADEYIIQTYDQSNSSSSQAYQKANQTSAFLIVATENNTVVDITPTVETLGGHSALREFTITLNKGQTYQVRSNNTTTDRDLSGSKVTSRNCKRIAVFNGNTLTAVPNNGSSFDHIFEQAMPLQSWGKRFVVTSSLERENDYVKVTSSSDNNRIYKNGQEIATLSTDESVIFELRNDEKSCFVEADGRVAVYLYHTTRGGNSIGDPSVVWIAPIEQRIDDITFSTFNNEHINIDNHHVNIIVNSEDVGTVVLDGNLISPSEFSFVNGSDQYCFTRQNIRHGVHRLQCANGFNAHVYGFGIAKGYAYLVGSTTANLTTKVNINNQLVQTSDTIPQCFREPVTFNAEINLLNYDLLWNFGDGTTSTSNPVTHTYDGQSIYHASLIITTDEIGGCTFSSSDTSLYYIDTRLNYEFEETELCEGEVYEEHGFHVVVTNDTILRKPIDNPDHPLCPDSLFVYITALDGFYAAYNDILCWQGESITYTEHGFNIDIDHPGTYSEQISAPIPGGCDSIVDLTLLVTDRIINPNPIEYSGCMKSFTWNNVTYTESGDYEQVFLSAMGCDSIIQLHIILDEAVEGGTDTVNGICTAYEWHGHFYDQPGFYTDTIPNSIGCDSIVHLNLSLISGADPSEIQPMDTVTDTPHWVISATEFEINYYDFTVTENNPEIVWDSVQWSFETDNNNWVLRPFGEGNCNCRVVVVNHVEDTVWLNARIYDPCHPGESIVRRYWLICSFYDIDEHYPSTPSTGSGTSSIAFNFDIVPNPNNGQMDIITTKIDGPVEVKVYNMSSLLIHEFVLSAHPESHYSYTLSDYPSGIYLMALNYKGGIVTKKFVIIK